MDFPVTADAINKRRRTKHIGDAKLADGIDNIARVDKTGPREVHVGNNSRHAQRGTKEAEERKGSQIHFARLNMVGGAKRLDLSEKVLVCVNNAFGGSGAARSKKDLGDTRRGRH